MFEGIWIYWLFPILFMTHEIEEILYLPKFVKCLKKESSNNIIKRIPAINRISFVIIVFEQLIVIISISLFCYISDNISLYIALIIVYIIHILIHYLQAIIIKKIIPGFYMGTFSSIILILILLSLDVSYSEVLVYIPIVLLLAVVNLVVMHKITARILKY